MCDVNTKNLHPDIWTLFDRYVHGLIDRRGFLDGVAKYAVGGTTALGTTPRYSKDAAMLAWQRTLDHFTTHLKATS